MDEKTSDLLLVIFDVDGTLVDAAELDDASFDLGFREVTGAGLPASVWAEFEEITAGAIIRRASGAADLELVQTQVRTAFLTRLRAGLEFNREAIRPFPGAAKLLDFLREQNGYRVAIATGCWEETAKFKLAAAGLNIDGFAFASASDRERRSEIIALAAERAGVPLSSSVYVGDGAWDLRAANQLGIPFIGVGRSVEKLQREGARDTSRDLSVESLADLLEKIRGTRASIMSRT